MNNNHQLNCLLCQQEVSKTITTDELLVKEYYPICVDCLNQGVPLNNEKLTNIHEVWGGLGFLLTNPQKSNNEWFILKALSIMLKSRMIKLEKDNSGRTWLIVNDKQEPCIILGDGIKNSTLWEKDE